MALGIIIAVVSVLVTLFIVWQQFQERDRSRGPSRLRVFRSGGSVFRSVGIDANDQACAAAKVLRGQRILLSDAPRLPLGDCDRETCECRYIYFADRRDAGAERRESTLGDHDGRVTPLREQRQQDRRERDDE